MDIRIQEPFGEDAPKLLTVLKPFIFWLAVACNVAFVMPFL